jgi:hypothetical protein
MRRIELFCGFMAGILGVAAMAIWFLALPINVASLEGINGTITPEAIRNASWGSSAFVYMGLLGVLSITVTISSIFHVLWQSTLGRFLLWVATGFLFLGTLCAFGLGLLFWPGSIMGLICTAAAVLGELVPAHPRKRFPTHVRV